MKSLIPLIFLFLACTTSSRKDWDSGADAKRTFQEETIQEQTETMRNQMPGPRAPVRDQAQPF